MRIKITAKNIVWDTDDKKVKLPKCASHEFKFSASEPNVDIEDMMAGWLSDTYGWCVKTFDFSYDEVADKTKITHAAAIKFLKTEAAKLLEKTIAFRAKPECDAVAWLKWLDKNINAKGYVLNFNSMTGEPISISTQSLAFA